MILFYIILFICPVEQSELIIFNDARSSNDIHVSYLFSTSANESGQFKLIFIPWMAKIVFILYVLFLISRRNEIQYFPYSKRCLSYITKSIIVITTE
jgi:hypothetical protein